MMNIIPTRALISWTRFVIENIPRNLTKLIYIYTPKYEKFEIFSENSRGLSLGVGLCK